MIIDGIKRRIFRRVILRELERGQVTDAAGSASLNGYDINMTYPNRNIWIHQVQEIIFQDCYSVWKLPQNPVVVDCGANIGMFTLNVFRIRPNANVLAIEPDEDNLQHLQNNIRNINKNQLEVLPVALGGRSEKAYLSGSDSDAKNLNYNGSGDIVDVVTLSSLLKGRIDLLKLDVEGSELDVLHGASSTLENVDRIFCEYHDFADKKMNISEVLTVIQHHGFDRVRVSGHREFRGDEAGSLRHCCLIEAWRSEL